MHDCRSTRTDQDETGLTGRSLAVEGSEATEEVADGRGQDGPSLTEPASAGSTAEPEARPSPDSDPWGGSASEPATAEERAGYREVQRQKAERTKAKNVAEWDETVDQIDNLMNPDPFATTPHWYTGDSEPSFTTVGPLPPSPWD